MKSGIIIAIVIGIIGIGVVSYSMSSIEDTGTQEIFNDPDIEEPIMPEGKNLSITLKESVGVAATP